MIVTCPACRTRYRRPEGVEEVERCRCSQCARVFTPEPSRVAYRVLGAPRGRALEAPAAGRNASWAGPGPRPGGPDERPRGARLTFGMDEPGLAEQVARTALDSTPSGGRPVLTYHVVADEPRAPRPPAAVGDLDPSETVVLDAAALMRDGAAPEPEVPEPPAGMPASLRFPEQERPRRPAASAAPPDPAPRAEAGDDPLGLVLTDPIADESPELAADDVELALADRRRASGFLALLGVLALTAAGFAAGWWLSVEWGRDPQAWGPAGAAAGLVAAWIGVRSSYRNR